MATNYFDYKIEASETKKKETYIIVNRKIVFKLPYTKKEINLNVRWALDYGFEPIGLVFTLNTKKQSITGKWVITCFRHPKFTKFYRSKDFQSMLEEKIVQFSKTECDIVRSLFSIDLHKIIEELKNSK